MIIYTSGLLRSPSFRLIIRRLDSYTLVLIAVQTHEVIEPRAFLTGLFFANDNLQRYLQYATHYLD